MPRQPAETLRDHQRRPGSARQADARSSINSRLRAQPLHELQVRLAVLGAKRAYRVFAVQIKTPLRASDTVLLEDLCEDLRHTLAAENAR